MPATHRNLRKKPISTGSLLMKTTRSARRCGLFFVPSHQYAIAPAMRTSRSVMSPISAVARTATLARRASRAGCLGGGRRLAFAGGGGSRLFRFLCLLRRPFEGAFKLAQQHFDEAAPLLARELGRDRFLQAVRHEVEGEQYRHEQVDR